MAQSKTCFLNGICGGRPTPELKKALEDPVLAPFIEVQIKDSRGAVVAQANNLADEIYGSGPLTLGVGQRTTPQNRGAFVKSLQVGTARGAGCDIEILDQEGGDFRVVLERVSRGGTATDSLCWVRWGWIATKCDGTTVPVGGEVSTPQTPVQAGMVSPQLRFVITNVDLDYSVGTTNSGAVKYTIHCSDTLQTFVDTKVPGTEPGPSFREAITSVCNRAGVAVQFKAFTSASTSTPFSFRVADAGNVSATCGRIQNAGWRGDNRNVLECFTEWLRGHTAQVGGSEGRGIRMYFDPGAVTSTESSVECPAQDGSNHTVVSGAGPNGSVIFMADTAPSCTSHFDPTPFILATYVINGGKCHPVISFKPKIGFSGTIAYATGGTGGGSTSPGTTANRGPSPCLNNPDAMPHIYRNRQSPLRLGHNVSMTMTRDERLGLGVRAMRYAYNSMYMNNLAMIPWSAVSAELKVQGDPSFSSPINYIGRFLNLIVINPFQIEEDSPCRWSNRNQPCNEVLSNGTWIIDKVFHEIRAGSYTTTFSIRLATPGYDVRDFGPLGG